MWRWFIALVFGVMVASALPAQAQAPGQGAGPPDTAEAGPRNVDADYRLGSGDKVRIIVFREESLTGEFLVPGGEGKIAFPLVGDVQAGGLTVTQLQAELEAKLKDGFLKEPRVSIEVLNYRPFYILGEVTKPGEYPYTNGLTVLNAVATANGFTYRADTHKVYIKRANQPIEEEYHLSTSTPVQPGDTIRIGEHFF
jgi:protein involved in polysaccharide export with SLBB domain